MSASASATAAGHAEAAAQMLAALQIASGGAADAVFLNGGAIDLTATALAQGSAAFAIASVGGIAQVASASGAAAATATNSGTMNFAADAHAVGASGNATATAIAGAAIQQSGAAGQFHAEALNKGTIYLAQTAVATGGEDAFAFAFGVPAILQIATGEAVDVSIVNEGYITELATGTAVAGTAGTSNFASATARAAAIVQFVSAGTGDAVLSLANSGTIKVGGIARATADERAFASVFAGAAGQFPANSGVDCCPSPTAAASMPRRKP